MDNRVIKYECPAECGQLYTTATEAVLCHPDMAIERSFCDKCGKEFVHLAGCSRAAVSDEPEPYVEPIEDPQPTTFDLTCMDGTVFSVYISVEAP